MARNAEKKPAQTSLHYYYLMRAYEKKMIITIIYIK